jgi:raffinose/stachyose/melibiose transport system substrate-binding protein
MRTSHSSRAGQRRAGGELHLALRFPGARGRQRLRRWLSSVAVLPLIAIAVAACSSGSSGADGSSVTLTITSLNDFQTSLPPVIKKFTQENPNISIQASYIPSQTYETLISTQLSNGTAGDIISVTPGGSSTEAVDTLAADGYLKNLSSQSWADKVPVEYKDSIGINNKVYFTPMTIASLTALYNQTALTKYHLTIPRTWNQVLAFCAAAKKAGTSAYAIGAATDYENQMIVYMIEATLVGNAMPNFITERYAGKVTFADSPWLETFQKEQQMLSADCIAKDPLGTSISAAQAEVANGQAMAYFGQSVQGPQLQALAPSDKFVLTSFPSTNDSSQTRLPIFLDDGYGINAKIAPSKLGAAEKFLDFLMEPAQIRAWAAATNGTPAIPDPQYAATSATQAQVAAQQSGKFTLVADQFFPNPNVRTVWITTNEKMLAGQASPADIVDAMDKAWDAGKS